MRRRACGNPQPHRGCWILSRCLFCFSHPYPAKLGKPRPGLQVYPRNPETSNRILCVTPWTLVSHRRFSPGAPANHRSRGILAPTKRLTTQPSGLTWDTRAALCGTAHDTLAEELEALCDEIGQAPVTAVSKGLRTLRSGKRKMLESSGQPAAIIQSVNSRFGTLFSSGDLRTGYHGYLVAEWSGCCTFTPRPANWET